jgi:C4-dicarboxylate-binding protein DctP
MVNAAWWSKLDPELQKIIQDTVTEVTKNHRARAEAESQKALTNMRAAGVNVHVQTDAERKEWMEATKPIWTQFEGQIGKQLIEEVQNYAK